MACTGWFERSRRRKKRACVSWSAARWRSTGPSPERHLALRRVERRVQEPLPHPHREPRASSEGAGAQARGGGRAQSVRRHPHREGLFALAGGLWCLFGLGLGLGRGRGRRGAGSGTGGLFGERLSVLAWRHLDGEDAARLARAEAMARALARAGLRDQPRSLRESRTTSPSSTSSLHSRRGDARRRRPGPLAERRGAPEVDAPRWRGSSPNARRGSRAPATSPTRAASRCASSSTAFPATWRRDGTAAPASRPTGAAPPDVRRRAHALSARAPGRRARPDREGARAHRELEVAPYFLSVHAIIEMARARDILCQGRGSAANSAVCYCLGITAVDPARSNLLFERFLSAERASRPTSTSTSSTSAAKRSSRRSTKRTAATAPRWCARSSRTAARARSARWARCSACRSSRSTGSAALVSWWDKLDEIDGRSRRGVRLRPEGRARPPGAGAGARDPGLSAPPVDPRRAASCSAPSRSWTSPPSSRRRCGSHGDPLGQGRPRHARLLQGRRPRPGHAHRDPQGARSRDSGDRRVRARQRRDERDRSPGARSRRRTRACTTRSATADTVGVFQIESRAQMAMLPAPPAAALLRSGRRGGDRAPRPDPGRHGPSVPAAAHRAGGGRASPHPMPRADPRTHARRAALSGAGDADRHRRRRVHRRRGRSAPARHGGVAQQRASSSGTARACSRASRGAASPASSASGSTSRSRASASTASPRATRRASRSSSTRARGSRSITRRRSLRAHQQPADGLLLAGHDRARTPSATASRCCRRASTRATGTARSRARPGELDGDPPALRLGLRLVERPRRRTREGVSRAPGARAAVRGASRTSSRGPALDRRALDALARAGALAGFGLGRREALWKTRAPREDDSPRPASTSARRCAGARADVARRAARARLLDHGGGRRGPRHERRASEASGALQERARPRVDGARGAREHGGAGHLPAATANGERRRVHHARGRDGVREPHRVELDLRALAARRDHEPAARGPRQGGTRRGRHLRRARSPRAPGSWPPPARRPCPPRAATFDSPRAALFCGASCRTTRSSAIATSSFCCTRSSTSKSSADLNAYEEHSRETFDLVLQNARKFAREVLLPTYKPMDEAPPHMVGGRPGGRTRRCRSSIRSWSSRG